MILIISSKNDFYQILIIFFGNNLFNDKLVSVLSKDELVIFVFEESKAVPSVLYSCMAISFLM